MDVERFVHRGPVVVLPAPAALFLARAVSPHLRAAQRLDDPTVYRALVALQLFALEYGKEGRAQRGSVRGSGFAAIAEPATDLNDQRIGTGEVADMLGISTRAVRKACDSGRLTAELIDGEWAIDPADARAYRDQRA